MRALKTSPTRVLFIFLLICMLGCIIACKKQTITDIAPEEIAGATADKTSSKISVCHHGKTISINLNAWPDHQAHGDVRLDDQDGDGYVPNNACGYGTQGDCDDKNAAINPGATEICGNSIDENCNGQIDENCIPSVTICDQTWMLKNLDVSFYRNGDPIPQVTDLTAWVGLTTGAWCYYENNSANGPIYGKLYNWYAVNDPRGLAPVGWHVPSYDELTTLRECLGGFFVAGGKMKATTLWYSPNTGATNESGFTGLPGGNRSGYVGIFSAINEWGYFLSSTEHISGEVWLGLLNNENAYFHISTFNKTTGLSVRCVRN